MRERIVIGLLIAALVGCFSFLLFQAGVMHGSAEVMNAWNKQKQEIMLAESAAMQKRIAENGAKQAQIDQLNEQLEKNYADEKSRIADMRSAVDAGLRNAKTGNCPARTAAATGAEGAKSADPATAGTDILYEDRLRSLFDLLQRADEVTASCRALQTFITENGLVKND